MKLAIVGSRYMTDANLFKKLLEDFIEVYGMPEIVISGGAPGVDTFAELWAEHNNIPTKIFKPDWNKYGKAAGPIRNTYIIEECTHVLALPSMKGKGTQDSIKKANEKKKIVVVHYIS